MGLSTSYDHLIHGPALENNAPSMCCRIKSKPKTIYYPHLNLIGRFWIVQYSVSLCVWLYCRHLLFFSRIYVVCLESNARASNLWLWHVYVESINARRHNKNPLVPNRSTDDDKRKTAHDYLALLFSSIQYVCRICFGFPLCMPRSQNESNSIVGGF